MVRCDYVFHGVILLADGATRIARGINTACVLIPSVYRLGELMAPGKPVNSIVPNSTSTITCVNPALTKANETGLKRPPIAILWDDRIYVGPYLHALPKRDYSVAMRRVALL